MKTESFFDEVENLYLTSSIFPFLSQSPSRRCRCFSSPALRVGAAFASAAASVVDSVPGAPFVEA